MARIRNCAICNKEFKPRHANHKYCSDECRRIAQHFRNAAEYERHRKDINYHNRKAEISREWYRRNKERKDNARSINR